jgi:hypothetical protein
MKLGYRLTVLEWLLFLSVGDREFALLWECPCSENQWGQFSLPCAVVLIEVKAVVTDTLLNSMFTPQITAGIEPL